LQAWPGTIKVDLLIGYKINLKIRLKFICGGQVGVNLKIIYRIVPGIIFNAFQD
jgi:hypothetical protein